MPASPEAERPRAVTATVSASGSRWSLRNNSLALRLFLSATAWAVVILVITGIVLSSLYREGVERAFDRRLGVYLRTLVADVAAPEESGGFEKMSQTLGEPLFDLPLSGWYWQVKRVDPGRTETRASRSLWDGGLPGLQDAGVQPGNTGSREGYVQGPEDQRLRVVERAVDLGEEGHYVVSVAGDAAEIIDGNSDAPGDTGKIGVAAVGICDDLQRGHHRLSVQTQALHDVVVLAHAAVLVNKVHGGANVQAWRRTPLP